MASQSKIAGSVAVAAEATRNGPCLPAEQTELVILMQVYQEGGIVRKAQALREAVRRGYVCRLSR